MRRLTKSQQEKVEEMRADAYSWLQTLLRKPIEGVNYTRTTSWVGPNYLVTFTARGFRRTYNFDPLGSVKVGT